MTDLLPTRPGQPLTMEPLCQTCKDTGEYDGENQRYVCLDCDAALRGRVQHSTGPARAMYSQAALDAAVAAERERIAARFDIPPDISGDVEDWSRMAAADIRGGGAPQPSRSQRLAAAGFNPRPRLPSDE